jgi:hypothetical protein
MPFDTGTLQGLETALADGFDYHREMDNFILRVGVPATQLEAARLRANEAAKNSPRGWTTASKRYVAQELITTLAAGGETGDRYVASLITAVLKHNFVNVNARDAVNRLRSRFEQDRDERAERERQRRKELERRALDEARQKERAFSAREARRASLGEKFLALRLLADHQQRGYALERFLNEFFTFEGLQPRG